MWVGAEGVEFSSVSADYISPSERIERERERKRKVVKRMRCYSELAKIHNVLTVSSSDGSSAKFVAGISRELRENERLGLSEREVQSKITHSANA